MGNSFLRCGRHLPPACGSRSFADLDSMFGRSIAQYLMSPNRRRRGGLREGALAAIVIVGVGVCIIGTLVSILGVMWRRQMQQSERESEEEGGSRDARELSRRPELMEEGEEAGGTCSFHNGCGHHWHEPG